MELFKILGTIALDNAGANEEIEETTGKAKTLGEKFKDGITTVAKWGAATAAAATAAGVAVWKMAENAAGATDTIDKMSQKIGISREAYQELDFICSQSGTSVDTLQMGIKTLTNQMQSAAGGTKTATAMFDKLGVSIYDSNGQLKDQETMMWEALSALQAVENQTEKAALANDLFGRSGSELMPLLNGEAGSMEAMREQAHALGLVLSDEAVNSGVLFTDTVDQAKRALSAIGTQIGVSLMPIIQKVLDWVLANLPVIKETASSVFDTISTATNFLVDLFQTIVLPVISEVKDWIEIHADDIKQAISDLWEGAKYIWETIGQPVWDLIQECIGIVKGVFEEYMPAIREFVSRCFTDIKSFWDNNLKPCFNAIGSFIRDTLAPIFNTVFNTTIRGYVETAFNFIKSLWDNTLKPVLTGITDFLTGVFTGDWQKAWDGIGGIVKGVANGIIAAAEAMVNGAIDVLNGLIEGINSLGVVEAIAKVFGTNGIPLINKIYIPRLEKGGVLERGQVGFLEGNGAEAVVPLEKNSAYTTARNTP